MCTGLYIHIYTKVYNYTYICTYVHTYISIIVYVFYVPSGHSTHCLDETKDTPDNLAQHWWKDTRLSPKKSTPQSVVPEQIGATKHIATHITISYLQYIHK